MRLTLTALALSLVSTIPASAIGRPFRLCGQATKISSGFQLVADGTDSGTGVAWQGRRHSVGDFRVTFDYDIFGTGTLADGFTFALQTTSPSVAGGAGDFLGYADSSYRDEQTATDCGTLSTNDASFAIGFSNYQNEIRLGEDLVWTNNVSQSGLAGPHSVEIVKSGTTVNVYLDGAASAAATFTVAQANYANAYLGFTGATGGSSETVQITNARITR